jgi:hypothetical protein
MPVGRCRLCNLDAELCESHIIPAFAYRWMRETSGTGHIRLGTTPNRRAQDGHKRYLLCTNCETKFSRWETQFATQIFHPYSSGTSSRFRYGRYLIRFCISVSWRVLRYYREETSFEDYPMDLIERMDEAEGVWKDVLLERKPNPGVFEQHILPLSAIESHTYSAMPKNINRYLMRVIDMDVVRGKNVAYVYSKLGRFIILGFFNLVVPKQWKGTKVHGNEGFLEPRDYTLPAQFAEYVFSQAIRLSELNAQISSRQKARIDDSFRKNIDKVADSDALVAMNEDVRLFGRDAFQIDDVDLKDIDR